MAWKMTLSQAFLFVSSIFVRYFVAIYGFDSLMDNIYFDIKWPGPEDILKTSDDNRLAAGESILITTNNNEKYRCVLPSVIESPQTVKEADETTSATIELDLLKPLFEQSTCTYRLETYWTYELCNGRHLRQYHEEKESGKKPKIQEYYLGRYKMETFYADYEVAKQAHMKSDKKSSSHHRIQKVQGIEIPYYEVVYTDGTACDLTGQPRKAYIHYVCQPDGRGEIYELKETSSCEYEVVVLSSQLCAHPVYGPKKDPSNVINCHSVDGSPKRPFNLDILELESSFEQFNGKKFWHEGYSASVQSFDPEFHEAPSSQKPPFDPSQVRPLPDNAIAKEFVDGSLCIEGGTGWWRHKYCYGRQVLQFHADNVRRDTIVLGEWNEEAHLKWIKANPSKQPKPLPERKQVSLYHGNGDLCDLTGRRRSVEVKLRCVADTLHPNAISIYLNEPKVCDYVLVVESSVLCDLVAQADDNGLIQNPKL